jgi:RNA polymerase sigma factor (sigma-70 family)
VERSDVTAEVLTFPTDAALLERARVGDTGAFEELYRRHAQAAWRLAQAVTRNADDASDAVSEAFTKVFAALQRGSWSATSDAPFRPYLLAAVRNAAIDAMRRSGRYTKADEADHPTLTAAAAPAPSASEHVVRLEDAALVAAAFRSLPERWRSVLWLTEVEGVPAREAASMLGLSPNGTAQLAVRARAGLRERYLQAHLQSVEEDRCKFTVERLGAYVAGGLAARDIAKVDQHLAGCADCRARQAELEDVGTGLRRIMLPLPAVLASAAAARWKTGLAASTREAGVLDYEQILEAPLFRKALGAAAAAVFTAGMIAAPFLGDNGDDGLPLAAPEVVQFGEAADDPVVAPETTDPLTVALDGFGGSDTSRAGVGRLAVHGQAPTGTMSVAPAATTPAPKAPPPEEKPATSKSSPLLPPLPLPGGDDGEPLASVDVGGRSGDNAGTVSATVGDTVGGGAQLGDATVGEPGGEPPAEDGLQIDIGGGLLPAQTITLP